MSPVSPRRPRLRTFLLWAAPLTWLGCGGGGGTDVVLPSLSVTTATGGVELDSDGYTLAVDGAGARPIGPAATVVVDGLSDGAHTLELSGIAPNCAIQGENPRPVTIRSGSTSTVDFAVTCAAASGTLAVATTTSGSGSDPDGFALLLDGAEQGAIGASATVNLTGLPSGTHLVGLTGLAANCQVVGENPRSVTITPGQTAQVPFAVACAEPAPSTGTLEITTATAGSDPDPDGYTVRVDGGPAQPIGPNATITLANYPASAHAVRLLGLAPNCTLAGTNPAPVTVPNGGTGQVAFSVSCTPVTPATGTLQIRATTAGAPDPDGYTASVDGGAAQTLPANGNLMIENLSAGTHSIQLAGWAANCTLGGDNPRTVTIAGGQTATVTFNVTCVTTGPSVNLRIERMYLTQSTQRLSGDVPLVQGRDGYIRVFATANASNGARPDVRVRFYQNGSSTPTSTLTIPAAGSSTPTEIQEGSQITSWNIRVPGSIIQSSTRVLADVDPANVIAETNESDNSFPASGTPVALAVQSAPPAFVRFVSILQTANGLRGNVGNPDQLMDLARRMYPLNGVTAAVRSAVFTVSGPLQPLNDNGQWGQILSDLEALRIADNASDETYFGLVRVDYGAGINGNGFVGLPSAIGSDDPTEVRRVVAHELGHTWGQLHTPCGSPPGVDPDFPYRSGNIGVYGYDVSGGALRTPSQPDIMGYCENSWVSDYIYEHVMTFRRSNPVNAGVAGLAQPCVLLWGHITNGRAVLEPAFQITTRPSLPKSRGPYSVEAIASDGSRLFTLSFEATASADDPKGSRHFAFAVPLDQARAAGLGILRLTGPAIGVAAVTQTAKRLLRESVADTVTAQREVSGVMLKWNAVAHPMIMVRDPDTGEVLSFARGGNARVWTGKSAVDLEISDGVRSHRVRRAISR
jgi:hypothetical protein